MSSDPVRQPQHAPQANPLGAPWQIVTDNLLTRRKRYHAVMTPLGDCAFKSRVLWDCVEYLDAEGVREYVLRNGALTGCEEVDLLYVSKG